MTPHGADDDTVRIGGSLLKHFFGHRLVDQFTDHRCLLRVFGQGIEGALEE